MFRHTSIVSLVAVAALGDLCVAVAEEPNAVSVGKQITNSIGMKLTLIPSGEFMMGSGESAKETVAYFKKTYGMGPQFNDIFMDEHPQHRVRITKPFYLGTYHVTRGQFRQFATDSGYKTDSEEGKYRGTNGWDSTKKDFVFSKDYSWRNMGYKQTDAHPVVDMTWNDAVAFCKWLSKKEGKTYHLPTEAEWEYACRAGTPTRYCSGDDPETLATVANIADATFSKAVHVDAEERPIRASDGYAFTAPVGQFKANTFGLHDMQGNAWQWCADWYSEDYYGKSPVNDPKGPDNGSCRVLRGGSCGCCADNCRSANRIRVTPYFAGRDTGFRVARTLQ